MKIFATYGEIEAYAIRDALQQTPCGPIDDLIEERRLFREAGDWIIDLADRIKDERAEMYAKESGRA